MPLKKTKNPKNKKVKKNKNKGKKRKTGYSMLNTISPVSKVAFPNNKTVRMRYVTAGALSGNGLTNYQTVNYKANGIYDPEVATGGHQPLGHDEWMLFYNHYVVIGSKITAYLTHADTSSVSTDQILAGIYLDDNGTLNATNISTLAEQGLCQFKIIPNYQFGQANISITQSFSAKKFFNVSDVKDNVQRIGAQFGNDPIDTANFMLIVGDAVDGTSSFKAINYTVVIDYICVLSEPKELAQS